MKLLYALPLVAGIVLALIPREEAYVFLLSGDSQGLLTPCGCTQPMSGGMRRKASAIRSLWRPGHTVYLENGGLAGGGGRQSQLKLEAQADLFTQMNVTAVHLTRDDLSSGPDAAIALRNVVGESLLGDSTSRETDLNLAEFRTEGPFLIGVAATATDAGKFIREASADGLKPLLMLDGTFDLAASLAKRFPALELIQYRSGGHPHQDRISNALLVTPGDKGKSLVRLEYSGGKFSGFQAIDLGPQHADDPVASKVFRTYLDRVREEKLVEQLPRETTAGFAGTATCAKCHTSAAAVWKKSGHSGALAKLENVGEQFDPECLRCHVVGLDSTKGFHIGDKPFTLGAVGCESCHGPGKAHALNFKIRLRHVKPNACVSCHTVDQSPNFQFKAYWVRIKH